jgi:6-pyruvoyltetrahydropterin/6-carboxytetrahydropterin synthase
MATYEVSVSFYFDAAHYLRNYKGKCENLHGHRFQVIVSVETEKLDEFGISFDFTELKKHLREVLDNFDHTCLNDMPPFDKINPSSENIAIAIYNELKPRLGERISKIQVWESPESRVTYIP